MPRSAQVENPKPTIAEYGRFGNNSARVVWSAPFETR
jgi:hypothetical protein